MKYLFNFNLNLCSWKNRVKSRTRIGVLKANFWKSRVKMTLGLVLTTNCVVYKFRWRSFHHTRLYRSWNAHFSRVIPIYTIHWWDLPKTHYNVLEIREFFRYNIHFQNDFHISDFVPPRVHLVSDCALMLLFTFECCLTNSQILYQRFCCIYEIFQM